MKYFIDTEFFEGFHKPMFGKRRHFIDLISIGIVAEDGRKFYAVSNEFDLKRTWNKWDKAECCRIPLLCTAVTHGACDGFKRQYWLRDNVLRPLISEHVKSFYGDNRNYALDTYQDNYTGLKRFMQDCGLSNNDIADKISRFIGDDNPEFYAYYADYDWVVFCSLFGRMLDLPKGFPMYCKDLKQMLDERAYWNMGEFNKMGATTADGKIIDFEASLENTKASPLYPKQTNEHSALDDAKWNFELYKFLKQK